MAKIAVPHPGSHESYTDNLIAFLKTSEGLGCILIAFLAISVIFLLKK